MPGIFFFGCRLVGSLYYAYICSMKHSSHSSFALLFITASTMLGIVVAERMWLAMPPLAWLLMAVAALVPTLLLGRYKWSQSFLLLVCFFCAGGWLCSWRMDEALVRLPERPVVYEAIVTDTPRPGVYELSVVRMADSTAPLPFKVHAQIAADTRLMVGDGIEAQSRLRGIRRAEAVASTSRSIFSVMAFPPPLTSMPATGTSEGSTPDSFRRCSGSLSIVAFSASGSSTAP